jgi:hypothetical protein
VFLLWPDDARRPARNWRKDIVAVAAAVVVGVSLASGIYALGRDLRAAFFYAGPSVFTPDDRRQMDAVRAAVPAGASLLLVATRGDAWHARLWQRGLYPEQVLIVRYQPLDSEEFSKLRSQFAIHYAVSLGAPPTDPGFRWHRDLGTLPLLQSRVWFGELEP